MALSTLYKALEVTLKNDQKFETCTWCWEYKYQGLDHLICFQFSLFPQGLCEWALCHSLGLWNWTWKMTQKLKFVSSVLILQISRLCYFKLGAMFLLVFSNIFYKYWIEFIQIINMVFNLEKTFSASTWAPMSSKGLWFIK